MNITILETLKYCPTLHHNEWKRVHFMSRHHFILIVNVIGVGSTKVKRLTFGDINGINSSHSFDN